MTNIPKSITICGKPHSVKLDKEFSGGSFNEANASIVIGTAHKLDVPEILLHEVIEAVFAIRNMRYITQRAEPDNGDYRFMFNHEEFEQAVRDIAAALKGIKF
jgi:hypothetical protein